VQVAIPRPIPLAPDLVQSLQQRQQFLEILQPGDVFVVIFGFDRPAMITLSCQPDSR
jgi:hypothetical protein